MLYFFEITNGTKSFKDHEGQRCRSRIAAGARAAQIAAELAAEGETYTEFAVRLLDDQGSELACVPVGSGRASRRALLS